MNIGGRAGGCKGYFLRFFTVLARGLDSAPPKLASWPQNVELVRGREYSAAAMHVQTPLCSLRPPLKWAGGKRWLVPHLLPIWKHRSHRRLVEPFCGGLAVSL